LDGIKILFKGSLFIKLSKLDLKVGVTQKENKLVNKAKNKEATKNNLSNLEFE